MVVSQKVTVPNSGASPQMKSQPNSALYPQHSKNTYRHVAGHPQVAMQHHQYSQVPYPHQMSGQYYTHIPAQNYGNVYNAVPHEQPFYYYQWPPGHMPIQQYHQQAGYNASPPNTPPQSGMQYGYAIPHPVDMHHATAFLPPTPPHQHQIYTGTSPVVTSNESDRKPSWSSSVPNEAQAASYAATSGVSGSPLVVGGNPNGNYIHGVVNTDAIKTYGPPPITAERVDLLLRAGPHIPEPIPGVFANEATKTMGESLENPTHTTNVYIRGLPPDTDDDKLLEMVQRFGDIISHKAIMDTEHGTCKGYGFARYETIGQAEDCIRGLVSLKYEAGFARESFNARLKTLADPNSTNVYVSNLPRSMNEKDMQDIFEGYIVVSNRILRDTSGNSRGVGFARFEDRNICDEIIKVFHGKLVGEEQLPLQVRYADTSAQKRLKATTTKKRQYRSNEYNNNVVNAACYVPSGDSAHPVQYRNRVWHRHNSIASNYSSDAGVTLERDAHEYDDDEQYGVPWPPNENIKLETVHENGDDTSSEDGSELTTVPSPLELVTKCSSGSFSDPGESYGGLESA